MQPRFVLTRLSSFADLPAPVMKEIRKREELDSLNRRIDWKESKARDKCQELDDLRRRTRQQRLAALRGGAFAPWIDKNRGDVVGK